MREFLKFLLLATVTVLAFVLMIESLQAQNAPDFGWPTLIERLDKVDASVASVNSRLSAVESRLYAMDTNLKTLLQEVRELKTPASPPVRTASLTEPAVTYGEPVYYAEGCDCSTMQQDYSMNSMNSVGPMGGGGIFSRWRARRQERRASRGRLLSGRSGGLMSGAADCT